MDIREVDINPVLHAFKFVDIKGSEGYYYFDDNKFSATKPYKANSRVETCATNTILKEGYELYDLTLNQNITLSPPGNLDFGDTFIIIIRQDSTGGHTVTFSSDFIFQGGGSPTITATSNAVDVVSCMVDSKGKVITNVSQDFA